VGRLDAFLADLARKETRQRLNVEQALDMVTSLPRYAALDSFPEEVLPPILRIASLESYLVNVRLLGDFFIRMPSEDFSARSFVSSWKMPYDDSWRPSDVEPGTPVQRLNYRWNLISQAVVHFGQARVPNWEEMDQPIGTDLADLEQWTDDCLTILRRFVNALAASNSHEADSWRFMAEQFLPPSGQPFHATPI
jgi:hypothetical protein